LIPDEGGHSIAFPCAYLVSYDNSEYINAILLLALHHHSVDFMLYPFFQRSRMPDRVRGYLGRDLLESLQGFFLCFKLMLLTLQGPDIH
jgi:hypothetical protein